MIACLAAAALTGCTASRSDRDRDREGDCQRSGTAVATAVSDDGRTWTARTAATEKAPRIGGGYVLLLHACGWTAVDLENGDVAAEGDGEPVGIAGGLVFTIDAEGDSVRGEPVVEDEEPGGSGGMVVSSPGSELQAFAVDDRLYVFHGSDGPATLTQYDGSGDTGWDALLPVLRSPAATTVGATLVVTSADGSVYGIDTVTGTVRWRVLAPTLGGTHVLRVRALDDAVVLTDWAELMSMDDVGTAVVLDAATGERLDRTIAPDPLVPLLEADGDGWRVTVESDPVPHVVEE